MCHNTTVKRISLAGGLLVALAWTAGCRSKAPEPYAVFFSTTPAYSPAAKSSNAYDDYLILGAEAATTLTEPQTSSNSPGFRDTMRKKAEPLLLRLEAATRKPCKFEFRAATPMTPMPARGGWAKLGRALAWSVAAAVKDADWPQAARWTRVGLTFGYDLTGGSSLDGATGLAIADGVRTEIVKGVGAMPADQLEAVSKSAREALLRMPSAEETVKADFDNELAALEALQGAYRKRKENGLATISDQVYKDGREAVAYLTKMSEDERPRYFQALHDELAQNMVYRRTVLLKSDAATLGDSIKARKDELGKVKYRPWKQLVPHYFAGVEEYLPQRNLSLARTRILVLTCLAQAEVKLTGKAPDLYKQIAGDVTVDPYSGRPFGYAHAGTDFNVYSVGDDGRDDGGDSDNAGLHPDIRLGPMAG